MRTMLITDAWRPQVNGVVRTLDELVRQLEATGQTVEAVTPNDYRTVPMPTYPEIPLSLAGSGSVKKRLTQFAPDHVHIATEGPLGIVGRRACRALGLGFTTSYHTRFPEYLRARAPIPVSFTYRWLRNFHNSGNACLVATQSIAGDLIARGFENVVIWTRGVDHAVFHPGQSRDLAEEMGWERPVFMNVGRVSVEKNMEAFLDLELPGTNVVVGDGPSRQSLERRFPDTVFTGSKFGAELARHYAAADVFVFPSLTDTFGNVLLESLACGTPVAAYPVPGPLDVVGGSNAGVLNDDLRVAALAALEVPRQNAANYAARFTWEECARIFIEAGQGSIEAA